MAFNFRFFSNNVNGLPSSKKLVKMFKGQIVNKWQKDFEGDFFSQWYNKFLQCKDWLPQS